ncbi:hypothetical protein ACN6AT_18025 [Streptomyces sp. JL4002]
MKDVQPGAGTAAPDSTSSWIPSAVGPALRDPLVWRARPPEGIL